MENQETLTDICEELRSGEYAPLADRIEAARKREGVCRRSIKIPVEVVPTCSTAAMREALLTLQKRFEKNTMAYQDRYFKFTGWHWKKKAEEAKKWRDIFSELNEQCKAALAEPARECDVGSVEEQIQRYSQFCVSRKRRRVHPVHSLEWAQRPYDKESEVQK